jgi:hypothetical protein
MATAREDRFPSAADFLAALVAAGLPRSAAPSAPDLVTPDPYATGPVTDVTQPIRPGDKIR